MLKRKITSTLQAWKQEKQKPCLVVSGARQVGKTFVVDDFARNNYDVYIYINFELNPEYKSIFEGSLDIKTLKEQLEINFPTKKIIPGKTILFLDEIQSCPNARTALKSFSLDGTLDVIASGSLLGLYYKEVRSYPVGYEKIVELRPLDFEEFLWGLGFQEKTIKNLRDNFKQKKPLSSSILDAMNKYFRTYLLVGGMPKVVNTYLENSGMHDVRSEQQKIIESYKADVMKYASVPDKQKILRTFNSIPAQLAGKNKKFKYSNIDTLDNNASERKYGSALFWLNDAGIVNFCHNLQEPAVPLAMNVRPDQFKVYMRDTGLLLSILDKDIRKAILDDNLYINEGGIIENVCAEEIVSRYEKLFYFERKGKLEVDFILNIDGVATALEVKSGNNKQAKSLNSIIDNYPRVKRYIMLEKDTNVYIDEKGIEHYPLFMVAFL